MRYIIFTSLLLLQLLTGITLPAQDNPQQQFDKANQLYRQGRYTEAAARYQQLQDLGYHPEALFFNAGNAYYKANRIGQAVYNYEKALQLSPGNDAIEHNLALANQKVNSYVDDLPLVFFQRWWLQLKHLHQPNGWAVISLVLFWLLTAGILIYRYAHGFKKAWLRWGNYTLGALFVLYLIMAADTWWSSSRHDTGIIMNSSIKVKAAPDDNSKDMFEIQEGMKVKIDDATKDFCKIVLADGKAGWISCNFIKRL